MYQKIIYLKKKGQIQNLVLIFDTSWLIVVRPYHPKYPEFNFEICLTTSDHCGAGFLTKLCLWKKKGNLV